MIGVPLTVDTVAKWAHARVVGCRALVMKHLAIDSREVLPQTLFVALPGATTDGHAYLADVLKLPATALLIRARHYRAHRRAILAMCDYTDHALLIVRDPLRALLSIAARYLAQFSFSCRIAITGSSGKTTTKELLAAIIKRAHSVYYTTANKNSAIGVPLALMRIARAHDYLVVEAGTGYKGEIAAIARAIQPQVALITNIGHAHLEFFKSRRAIAKEKFSLALKSRSLAACYLRSSDRALFDIPSRMQSVCHDYDLLPRARQLSYAHERDGARVTIGKQSTHAKLSGAFQHDNLAAVVAVSAHLGIPVPQILAGIADYRPLFGRMQIIEGEVTVILDCYNANPESMQGALEYFAQVAAEGKKICIMGAMKELGGESARFHEQLFHAAIGMNFDHLFCVGEEFAHIDLSGYARADYCADVNHLADMLLPLLCLNDILLLKGSRSVGLERLLPQINARRYQEALSTEVN